MILQLSEHSFGYKIEHTIRIFYPNLKIEKVFVEAGELSGDFATANINASDSGFIAFAELKIGDYYNKSEKSLVGNIPTKELELELCKLLFSLLVEQSGIVPDWGILTGVRPTKKIQGMLNKGLSDEGVLEEFTERLLVTEDKAKLALLTAHQQREAVTKVMGKGCSLYVGIPFCPSRCLYCSFVSHSIENTHKLIEPYLELLYREINETLALIKDLGFVIETVYIGGGTPTVLDAPQLERLLTVLSQIGEVKEFTLEAGRPDTISKEKLELAKAFGVDRISINPQTLNPAVLKTLGRNHSIEDFYKAFEVAKGTGFKTINTDLIAGLSGENAESFLNGLEKIIALAPENITVHSLTTKKSSTLKTQGGITTQEPNLSQILARGREILEVGGYLPYYLYRQKGTVQNQENVGYSKEGHQSLYNIYMMEEVETVFGVGAGTTTKLLLPEGKIKRIFNFKYPYEYIKNYEKIIAKKLEVRSYYEKD